MLEFRAISLADKPLVDGILNANHNMSCEYCFGNHFIWKKTYKVEIATMNRFYILKLENDENRKGISFLYPVGIGDIKPIIEAVIEYCNAPENNISSVDFHSASKQNVEELEELFPNRFEFFEDRDYFDYIYLVEKLVNLSGKKLHGKRNHIARFKENDWVFEPLSEENMQDCMAMNQEWCNQNDCGRDPSLREECCAVRISFKHFKELGFFGGLLRIDGRVVAYTIAERLNNDTVVIHMEKAFSDIQGAYPAINREFLAQMCMEYKYVNREEDLGVEGLRKAKLSYKPDILLEKYGVTLKNELSD